MEFLNKLCRLCLQANGLFHYTSIYEFDSIDSMTIIEKIKRLIPSLEFPEDTEQFVCQNCLILLRQFLGFKTVSEKNADTFLEIVKQLKPAIIPKESYVDFRKTNPVPQASSPETSPSVPPATTVDESIKTPKIVAVYSLQGANASDNSITHVPYDTIKIEDDSEDEIMSLPPSTPRKRISIESDVVSPDPKLVKLSETSDCNMPEIFKAIIWENLDADPSITTGRIQYYIGEKYKVWPCITEIEKIIKSFHYIVTRETSTTPIKNSLFVILSRLHYAKEYNKYNECKIVFGHEIGIRVTMRQSGSIIVKEFRVVAAMSQKELIYFSLAEQVYNLEEYGNWIIDLLPILKWKNIDKAFLVMENCPSYNIENKLLLEGHRFICLPPYSPFLNPLENIFSKWQRDIKALKCPSEEILINNMKEYNKLINQEDCEIVYDKMKCCLSRCRKECSF